jgi:hypothetical protein
VIFEQIYKPLRAWPKRQSRTRKHCRGCLTTPLRTTNRASLARPAALHASHHRRPGNRAARRNVGQPGDGWPRCRMMYVATVDCATSIPSVSDAPRMRGAPQRRFSRLSCRTRLRKSFGPGGHLTGRRDFQRPQRREPLRCQRSSVSGLKMIAISRRTYGRQAPAAAKANLRRPYDVASRGHSANARAGMRFTFPPCVSTLPSPASVEHAAGG